MRHALLRVAALIALVGPACLLAGREGTQASHAPRHRHAAVHARATIADALRPDDAGPFVPLPHL